MSWTICMHATAAGDYDDAEKIAMAMEAAARKNGAIDPFIEILEQDDPAAPPRIQVQSEEDS